MMTKRDKRLEKLRQNPKNVSFDELRRVGVGTKMTAQNRDLAYYLALPYRILLTPLPTDEGGGWLAEIPDLPGCMSDGDTQAEALQMIEDAKRLWIESSLVHGDAIPEPQHVQQAN